MTPFFIAYAHRRERKRFVARADKKLTAFMELESAIRAGKSTNHEPQAA